MVISVVRSLRNCFSVARDINDFVDHSIERALSQDGPVYSTADRSYSLRTRTRCLLTFAYISLFWWLFAVGAVVDLVRNYADSMDFKNFYAVYKTCTVPSTVRRALQLLCFCGVKREAFVSRLLHINFVLQTPAVSATLALLVSLLVVFLGVCVSGVAEIVWKRGWSSVILSFPNKNRSPSGNLVA